VWSEFAVSICLTLLLHQQGECVVLLSSSAPDSELIGHNRLTSIRYRRALLYIQFENCASRSFSFQPDGQQSEVACTLPDDAGLRIYSDLESLHFSQVQRPQWIDCLGRDLYGLYLELTL
jgi:hypothetical protein